MEFNKSNILTVVTADQAKVGSMGYFSNYIHALKECVTREYKQAKLTKVILDANYPFFDGHIHYSLFYPAPEPTYAERQAEWIKENNVKVGTKVRFTKGFDEYADGSDCCDHRDAKGIEGFVNEIFDTYISVFLEYDCWAVPFTAIEVIKEPTYRPYNNDELNDLVGKVLIQNHTGNAMMAIKVVDGGVGKLISLGGSQKRNAQQLLDGWTHKNGEPCGIKEEA